MLLPCLPRSDLTPFYYDLPSSDQVWTINASCYSRQTETRKPLIDQDLDSFQNLVIRLYLGYTQNSERHAFVADNWTPVPSSVSAKELG